MSLEWGANRSVGVDKFDKSHQAMALVINRLERMAQNNEGGQAALEALDELLELAQAHFQEEESELERRGYEDLADHQDEHLNILNEIRELRARQASASDAPSLEMTDFLANWMSVHVEETDKRYRRLFDK